MPEEKLKQVIQDAFDEASAGYDRPAMRFFDNSAQNLVNRLSLVGHEKILDAATGTGKIALALAGKLQSGHVTGVDISPGMLQAAARKATEAGIKAISFHQSDINEINFPQDYFDGLTCGFGVHFWSNMEQSMSRLLAMVRPNGFVAITSFAKGSFEPQATICLNLFSDFGIKLPASYSIERLDQVEKNKALFESIQLKNIMIEKKQVGYYLDQAEQWWDLVLFTGYRAFLNQLNPDDAERFKEKFLHAVEKTKDNKGVFLNVEVITSVGQR